MEVAVSELVIKNLGDDAILIFTPTATSPLMRSMRNCDTDHELYPRKVHMKSNNPRPSHQATYSTSKIFTTNLSNKPPDTSGTRSFEIVPDMLPDVSLSANSTMSASTSGMAPLCSTRCWRLMICSFPSTYGKAPYAALCGRRPGLP